MAFITCVVGHLAPINVTMQVPDLLALLDRSSQGRIYKLEMDLFEQFRVADAAKALQNASITGQATPIFSLKKFDWDKKASKGPGTRDGKARLVQDVVVSNNVIIIATTNCTVLRWNAMDASKEPERIEVPVVLPQVTKTGSSMMIDSGDSIEHVFIDPTANHVIIAMKSMDNYYLHSRSQKPKKLTRLQGVVECVAFDRHNCTESATRSFLLGTSTGVIYEMSVDSTGKEKLCQPVYQLEQPVPINSIYFDSIGTSAGAAVVGASSNTGTGIAGSTFTAAANVLSGGTGAAGGAGAGAGANGAQGGAGEGRLFVLWSTASPTRLYHLTGGPTLLALFSAYLQSGTTSYTELPALSVPDGSAHTAFKRAQLQCYSSKGFAGSYTTTQSSSTSQQFALMTEIGIYHGSLLFSNSTANASDGENVILEAKHVMYVEPSPAVAQLTHLQSTAPVSIGVTEHHFLVLRPGQLQMLSNLSGALVQEEPLKSSVDGVALALVKDPFRSALWLITTTSIFQVNASEEDRHVWKLYLNRAISAGDDALFESSLTFSKNQSQRLEIMRARAATSIQQGRLHLAAIYYAQSGLAFDEVALSLLHCLDTSVAPQSPGATGANAVALAAVGGGAGAGRSGSEAPPASAGASPFSALIESNASYFNAGPAGAANNKQYSRINYNSGSLVDAAIAVGAPLTPLKVFLLQVVSSLPSAAKMQRTMLCTWLCDLYLHQISLAKLLNTQGGASASAAANNGNNAGQMVEYESMAKSDDLLNEAELTTQLKNFLRANKGALDVPTTLSLITSRNNQALLLFYAQIVGDYHRVVSMFMSQERYNDAIAVLTDAPIEKVLQLIYKTAPVLIQKEPDATVNMLLSKHQLSLSGILPALLSYCTALDLQISQRRVSRLSASSSSPGRGSHSHNHSHGHNHNHNHKERKLSTDAVPLDRDFEGNEINFAIVYLKQTLARQGFRFGAELSSAYSGADDGYAYGTPEAACFHTIVWMLAKYDALEHERDEEELVALLTCMQESKAQDPLLNSLDIDYEYILRQCRLYKRRRAAVRALLLLDCTIEAVDEALVLDLQEAKALVLQQTQLGADSELLRQLWMEIAKVVIEREADMAVPIALIKESDGALTIDDLLPHLPNFTEIELFQEEICLTLQGCGDSIQYLKNQMKELADSAESTVLELESMKNRAYSMVTQQQRCEYCTDVLFGKPFYLFPCSHGFHCQCLVQRCVEYLPPAQVSAVQGVEEILRGLAGKGKDFSLDRRARAQQEALQLELDGYIAADCPLCGYAMIQSLCQPLVGEAEAEEAKAWAI